jgi:hypothetical protein
MNIKLPARHRRRDESRRPRRAARLSAVLAVLGVPALLGVTLTGTASASTAFTTHLTPENTFYLLLDVSGGSTYPGAPVIDWYSDGGANQNWLFVQEGTGTNYVIYEIVNVNSNMCLTTDGAAGDQLYQEPCAGSPDQLWDTNMTGSSTNYTTIRSDYSHLYLDVNGDSPWAGTSIDTWYYTGAANQLFARI